MEKAMECIDMLNSVTSIAVKPSHKKSTYEKFQCWI